MKIIANIISITGSQILSLILFMITFGYIARYLEVTEFGLFNYWLAVIGILAKLMDFGFGPIVFRECSKGNECNNNISTIFVFRTGLLIVFFLIMNLTLLLFDFVNTTIFLANILLLNIFFTAKSVNFRDLLYIFFKKDIKMQVPAMVNLFDGLLLLIIVLPIVFVENKFKYFIIVYLLANIPGFLYTLKTVIKKYDFKLKFEYSNLKWLIKESLPLYGFVFLSFIYLQLDIFMVSFFHGENAVGLYSASVRITRPLLMIPSAFVITFVPILVKKISSNLEIEKEMSLIFKFLIFLASVFTIIFYYKASFFTTFIFGEKYLASVLPAKYLFIALIFLFFNFFALDLLTIHNKQKYNLVYIIILVLTAFLLNLIFIPIYSIEGAAISRIVSAIVGFVFLFSIIRKHIGGLTFFNFKLFFWIIINFTITYLLKDLNIIIYLVVSLTVMAASLLLLKIFTQEEQNYMISAIRRK